MHVSQIQRTRQLIQHLATHADDRAALPSKYLVELLALANTRGLQDIVVCGILERILIHIAKSVNELGALLRCVNRGILTYNALVWKQPTHVWHSHTNRRLKACIHVNNTPSVCKLAIRLLPRTIRAAGVHLHPPSDHTPALWHACAEAVLATVAVLTDAHAAHGVRGMAAVSLYATAATLMAMPPVCCCKFL